MIGLKNGEGWPKGVKSTAEVRGKTLVVRGRSGGTGESCGGGWAMGQGCVHAP